MDIGHIEAQVFDLWVNGIGLQKAVGQWLQEAERGLEGGLIEPTLLGGAVWQDDRHTGAEGFRVFVGGRGQNRECFEKAIFAIEPNVPKASEDHNFLLA